MARTLTPAEFAARTRKWVEAGFNGAAIQSALVALEQDRREAEASAPSKSGAMRKTIRVIKPTVKTALKRGFPTLGLAAGSRTVHYASVIATGKVGYPPGSKTKEHPIAAQGTGFAGWVARKGGGSKGTRLIGKMASGKKALSFMWGGKKVVVRSVMHPGSRFKARDFLKINERRLNDTIQAAVTRSAMDEI